MAQRDKRAQKRKRRVRRKTKGSEPFVPSREDKYMSIDNGAMCFFFKISGTQKTRDGKFLNVKAIPVEDTIRPVTLKFTPPLQADGTDPTCFDYQWQQLTFLFELDDPATFANVFRALSDDDKRLLIRYVETCRNLAGYSIINSKNSFSLVSRGGEWTVSADLHSHQEFSGFSATFRQLHNDGEEASFVKAWNIINRALIDADLEEPDLAKSREVLGSWKRARARLKEKAAETLICERLDPNPSDEHPRTLKGVVPEDLIKSFNYGDTLHWGDHREKLAELTNDPFNANFHKFCCAATMTSLSHVYFGFAVLTAAALGAPGVR